ncbi:chemotaxis protein CheW [Pseudoprimorskyibacter insulae]|uniref:Chemotaxis protein CheW n=1 Tax=Pseudoprimorskyibacter insulae TaxID=1695997 RepID=A0A2R8ANZ9_9RHOB|nr:chemotaxis protein CheW [Pseudoprimorskyibacter insulae]SPF77589.1 Chemotaxis protein CheW [Pseudoprimorskyibacter insulae]
MKAVRKKDLNARLKSVVVFELGGQAMAVPTDILREILEPTVLTRVPCTDHFAPALMNVRGVIVPIVDLRRTLAVPMTPQDADTRILVLEVPTQDGIMLAGLIVDSVKAVIAVDVSTVQPVPDVGPKWPPYAMAAVSRWRDAFLYILDVEALLAARIEANLEGRTCGEAAQNDED